MKYSRLINYLYTLVLILSLFIFFRYRVKPNLKEIFIRDKNSKLHINDSKKNINHLTSPDNRVNVGKQFFIKDNIYWYKVIQLSFWRSEYFNLNFVEKQLKINRKEVRKLNNNNFALGTLENEKISYSCMQNPQNFHNAFIIEKIIKANDLQHWLGVFISNIDLIFLSFKPSNYECLLVITSDPNFFEKQHKEINEIIFSKFIYGD